MNQGRAKPEEEKNEVRIDSSNYVWATTPEQRNMVTLTEDIQEISVYAAGEAVLKSHIFSALGACLYEGKSMIVWIDYPIDIIKRYASKLETKRIYWNGSFKDRGYNCLQNGQDLFGLSPACQEFRIKDDAALQEFGLELKEDEFDFQETGWKRKVRFLEINVDKVTQEPQMSKIKKWLNMEEDKDEIKDKALDMQKELKERYERLERMKV